MLNREAIERLAHLSKLEISAEELDRYTHEIGNILKMVEELQAIDTQDVKPTFHGNSNHNVFREDKAVRSHLSQAMLANAPDAEDGFIRVPVIIESEEA